MSSNLKPIMFCTQPCMEIFDYINPNTIDTIHLYIDLKNSSTNLFIPDVVQEIVETSRRMGKSVESSIFQSIILTCSNWISAARSRGFNCRIIICNDKGRSEYHTKLNPLYKKNRKITNVLMEHYSEEMDQIKTRNWDFAEKICSKLNNIHFINLNFLESDFLPYYLITRYYNELPNVYHIISSCDKDHFQLLNKPNTIMFSRKSGTTTILDKQSYLSKFLKINKASIKSQAKWIDTMSKVNPEYIVLIMAMCGDVSDNVFGIPKIGDKTALKMISNNEVVNELIGTVDELEDRLYNGGKVILDKPEIYDSLDNNWKLAVDNNDLLTKAYKQISYESLSRWLDKTDMINVKVPARKAIDDNINKPFYVYNELHKENFIKKIKELIHDFHLNDSDLYNLF